MRLETLAAHRRLPCRRLTLAPDLHGRRQVSEQFPGVGPEVWVSAFLGRNLTIYDVFKTWPAFELAVKDKQVG